jgi:hypothetical protein
LDKPIIATTKIYRDYRIRISKEVHNKLELNEGDEIVFFTLEGRIRRVCFRKAH